MDHGTEFVLVVAAQMHLSSLRQNSSHHLPALQSSSRLNHRAERIWPEVNQRVNYPVKHILVDMENNGEIDMSDEVTKFCVSWVTITVMKDPVNMFIQAWNNHRIPGCSGGIPNTLASQANQVTPLISSSIPSTVDIIQIHEQDSGNQLCRDPEFGRDPLQGLVELQQLRQRDFIALYPDFRVVFHNILHSNGFLFRRCIQDYIRLTKDFAALV